MESTGVEDNERPPTGGYVLFDLDGTLVEGDSFGVFCFERALRAPLRGALLVGIGPLLFVVALLRRERRIALSVALWILTFGMDEQDYARAVARFTARRFASGRHSIVPAIRALLSHTREGDALCIVTGCEQFLAQAVVKAIHENFGTEPVLRVRVIGSKLTRKYGGFVARFHCYGERKLVALRALGIVPPYRVLYTDSAADLPLLRESERAVLVRPSRRNAARIRRAGIAAALLEVTDEPDSV